MAMIGWVVEFLCDHEFDVGVQAVLDECGKEVREAFPEHVNHKMTISFLRQVIADATRDPSDSKAWEEIAVCIEHLARDFPMETQQVPPLNVIARARGALAAIKERPTHATAIVAASLPDALDGAAELRRGLLDAAIALSSPQQQPTAAKAANETIAAIDHRFPASSVLSSVSSFLESVVRSLGPSLLDRVGFDIASGVYSPSLSLSHQTTASDVSPVFSLSEMKTLFPNIVPGGWGSIQRGTDSDVRSFFKSRKHPTPTVPDVVSKEEKPGAKIAWNEGDVDVDVVDVVVEVKVKRMKRPFSAKEVENLRKGVEKFKEGRWKEILKEFEFDDRTPVDLKDKWRNLMKKERREEFRRTEAIAIHGVQEDHSSKQQQTPVVVFPDSVLDPPPLIPAQKQQLPLKQANQVPLNVSVVAQIKPPKVIQTPGAKIPPSTTTSHSSDDSMNKDDPSSKKDKDEDESQPLFTQMSGWK